MGWDGMVASTVIKYIRASAQREQRFQALLNVAVAQRELSVEVVKAENDTIGTLKMTSFAIVIRLCYLLIN